MIKYILHSTETNNEILLAFISEAGFDSFELTENGLLAYLKNDDDQSIIETTLDELMQRFPFKYDKETIAYKNWNEIWESNFSPVIVDDFCIIRADFHKSQKGFQYEIIINPKMAFGTGHHETSYMMMQLMREIDFHNKEVLDFGAGTGILSILASYKGANSILAIDIEEESYLNTIENANKNKIDNIQSIHGILSDIEPLNQYNIILANINRNVLLESARSLMAYCKQPTTLLLSGILRTDIDLVRTRYQEVGFKFEEMIFKGEWVAIKWGVDNPI